MNDLFLAEIESAKKIMDSNNLTFATIWANEIDGTVSYGFNFDPQLLGYITFDGSVKRTVVHIVRKGIDIETWVNAYRLTLRNNNRYAVRLNELLSWDMPTHPKDNDPLNKWHEHQNKCIALLKLIRETYPYAYVSDGSVKLNLF